MYGSDWGNVDRTDQGFADESAKLGPQAKDEFSFSSGGDLTPAASAAGQIAAGSCPSGEPAGQSKDEKSEKKDLSEHEGDDEAEGSNSSSHSELLT